MIGTETYAKAFFDLQLQFAQTVSIHFQMLPVAAIEKHSVRVALDVTGTPS